MGPDTDMLINPSTTNDVRPTAKTVPVGADSSLKTWQGDQWKIGGGNDVGVGTAMTRS